jgi:hypothetical protein
MVTLIGTSRILINSARNAITGVDHAHLTWLIFWNNSD